MAQRQCEKCGEMVDEAKAFCPACGNAFVQEEKREQQSKFDQLDNTVQMGQTMYGQMLSDMGLNISKPAAEKRVEVIAPISTAPKAQPSAGQISTPETLQPAASAQPAAVPQRKSYIVWIIAAAALLLIGFVIVAILAIIFYYYGYRLR